MSENASNSRLKGPRSVSRASFDDWVEKQYRCFMRLNNLKIEGVTTLGPDDKIEECDLSVDEIVDQEIKRWEKEHSIQPRFYKSKLWALYKSMIIKEYKPMTINEYQQLALRTYVKTEWQLDQLINGLMGLNGEAGEAIDILKKYLFHDHDLDREHLAKELGDVAWYLAVTADAINYKLEDIFQMNIDKLRARYPDGFDSERSQHRAEGDI